MESRPQDRPGRAVAQGDWQACPWPLARVPQRHSCISSSSTQPARGQQSVIASPASVTIALLHPGMLAPQWQTQHSQLLPRSPAWTRRAQDLRPLQPQEGEQPCSPAGQLLHSGPEVHSARCREAVLEKKAARREAAKDREASPDVARLPGGGDPMGGDDSFAAAKARRALPRLSWCCQWLWPGARPGCNPGPALLGGLVGLA